MFRYRQENNPPDFNDPTAQNKFVQDTHSAKELLQKELNVNQEEQVLIKQRLEMMKEVINAVPSSDPHYAGFAIQMRMDQIELDELKAQETIISEKLRSI